MKVKENKGSIAIYVIVSFIFLTIVLLSMLAASKNAEITALKSQGVIKNIYENDVENRSEIYSKTAQSISEAEEPEPAEYTFYFEKPSTWETETPCVHIWNNTNGDTTTWPGIPMTYEGNNIYSITVDGSKSYDELMFTNGDTTDARGVRTQHVRVKRCNGYIFRANISETKTVYFENWYLWSKVYVYVWNHSSGASIHGWPGLEAKSAGKIRAGYDTERDLYSYEIGTNYDRIIFNNGSGSQSTDLNVSDADGAIWGIFNGGNAWHWELHGSWEKYEN